VFEELLPKHLMGILDIDEQRSDEGCVYGTVKCTCGYGSIRLQTGGIEYNDELSYNEQTGVMVMAECSDSGKEILLFDQAKHGYDGFVCGDFVSADKNQLTTVKCAECGSDNFTAEIGIEVEDRDQFIEECVNEFPERFKEEDFTEAFNWFALTVKCEKCGHTEDIIDLELT
jgi:ribosomal protein S27E